MFNAVNVVTLLWLSGLYTVHHLIECTHKVFYCKRFLLWWNAYSLPRCTYISSCVSMTTKANVHHSQPPWVRQPSVNCKFIAWAGIWLCIHGNQGMQWMLMELDLRAYPINAHVYVHMHCMYKLDPEVDSKWCWCNVHSVQAWNCTQLANGITLNSWDIVWKVQCAQYWD